MILALAVLGIVAVNAFKAIQGPQYGADARVLISTTPLSSIVAETEPSFIDPNRVQATALGVADSPRVYELAAKQSDEEYGTQGDLHEAVDVIGDPSSDLITFGALTDDAEKSVGTANAVASAFIEFRDELSRQQIEGTIDDLRARLGALPVTSEERASL
jgi:capsular polysaccharide biosynthesis protein